MKTIIFAVLLALTGTALAQTTTQTVRDSLGRTTGTVTTDTRNGVTTFRNALGRETGRATTNGGTATIYDPMGRQIGTVRSK